MPQRVHLGVFPSGAFGHITPMLELSRRFVSLGFTVSFILTEKEYGKMNPKDEGEIHFVSIPNPSNGSLMKSPEMQEQVISALKPMIPPVEFIVSDFFLGWTQDLANSLGVPRIAFVTCCSTGEELLYNIPRLHSKGFIPVKDYSDNAQLITVVPNIDPFHPKQLPMVLRDESDFSLLIGEQLQRMREAICILVNSVEELEQNAVSRRRLEFSNYFPVGPLVPDSAVGDSKNSCMNWLEKQAPCSVLYIAFGSAYTLPADKVEMIAKAVKATGKPFLWAMRRNFIRDAPESAYESVRAGLGDQGIVVDWVTQMQVLQHSAVSAFFTHCGWNSTMEAVCSGVPTLCWPCGAEQNINSSMMVGEWKIGVQVAEGNDEGVRVRLEDITEKIKLVMESGEGEKMRSRAQELRAVVRGSSEGGCSMRNLQLFKDVLLSAKV